MPSNIMYDIGIEIEGEYGGEGVYPWPIENERYIGNKAERRRQANLKRKLGAPELKGKPHKKRWCKDYRPLVPEWL